MKRLAVLAAVLTALFLSASAGATSFVIPVTLDGTQEGVITPGTGSGTVTIDDAFAKQLGLESLQKLRDAVKDRIAKEHGDASRAKLKRQLLDTLDARHQFELPPTLVDNEFQAIWQQVTADLERSKRSFEDEGTTEEKAKAEYRDIAARRVRLGLILSEVGSRNQITVSDEEVSRALLERVRQFPGQERKVYDYYRSNPQLLAELRAPILEDKTVDYVLELAKVTDTKVTRKLMNLTGRAVIRGPETRA